MHGPQNRGAEEPRGGRDSALLPAVAQGHQGGRHLGREGGTHPHKQQRGQRRIRGSSRAVRSFVLLPRGSWLSKVLKRARPQCREKGRQGPSCGPRVHSLSLCSPRRPRPSRLRLRLRPLRLSPLARLLRVVRRFWLTTLQVSRGRKLLSRSRAYYECACNLAAPASTMGRMPSSSLASG